MADEGPGGPPRAEPGPPAPGWPGGVSASPAGEPPARGLPDDQRERILRGRIAGSQDVVAIRRLVGLSQRLFARALGISVHTLRNWEQGRRRPEGPALALLRIAARHPSVVRENLAGPT